MNAKNVVVRRGQYGFMFHIKDTGEPYAHAAPIAKVGPGGPAETAGLIPGDAIVLVNGHPVHGKTQTEVANMIRASSGRCMELTIVSDETRSVATSDGHNDHKNTGPRRKSEGVVEQSRYSATPPSSSSSRRHSGFTGAPLKPDSACFSSVPASYRPNLEPDRSSTCATPEQRNSWTERHTVENESATSEPRVVRKQAYRTVDRVSPKGTFLNQSALNVSATDKSLHGSAGMPSYRSATDLNFSGPMGVRLQSTPRIHFRPRKSPGEVAGESYRGGRRSSEASTTGSPAATPKLSFRRGSSPGMVDYGTFFTMKDPEPLSIEQIARRPRPQPRFPIGRAAPIVAPLSRDEPMDDLDAESDSLPSSPGRRPHVNSPGVTSTPVLLETRFSVDPNKVFIARSCLPELGSVREEEDEKRKGWVVESPVPEGGDDILSRDMHDGQQLTTAHSEQRHHTTVDPIVCQTCRKSNCSCEDKEDNDAGLWRRESFWNALGPGRMELPTLAAGIEEEVTSPTRSSLISPESPNRQPSEDIGSRGDESDPAKSRNLRKFKNFFGENSKPKTKVADVEKMAKTSKSEVARGGSPVTGSAMVKMLTYNGKNVKSSWKPYSLLIDDDDITLTRDRSNQSSASTAVGMGTNEEGSLTIPMRGMHLEEESEQKHKKPIYRITQPANATKCLIQFPEQAELITSAMVLRLGVVGDSPSDSGTHWQTVGSTMSTAVLIGGSSQAHAASGKRVGKTGKEEEGSGKGKIQQAFHKMKNLKGKKMVTVYTGTRSDFERQREEWFSKAKSGILDDGPVFGVPLHQCPRSTFSPLVPLCVEVCVKIIEACAMNCVGIYRVSGNKNSVDLLAVQLSQSDIEEIDTSLPVWNDVHAVSGVLKSYLRTLSEPLFPKALYSSFMDACRMGNHERRLLRIQRLLGVMESCSDHPEYRHHRETLRYLCAHLDRVSQREKLNRMGHYNLATIFAPNVIQPASDDPILIMTDSLHRILLMETVIRYQSWIFTSQETPPSEDDIAIATGGGDTELPQLSEGERKEILEYETDQEQSGRLPGDAREIARELIALAVEVQGDEAPPLDLEQTGTENSLFERSRRANDMSGLDIHDMGGFGEVDIDAAVLRTEKKNADVRRRRDLQLRASSGSDEKRRTSADKRKLLRRHSSELSRPIDALEEDRTDCPRETVSNGRCSTSPTGLIGLKQLSVECLVNYEEEARQLEARALANREEQAGTVEKRRHAEEQLNLVEDELEVERREMETLVAMTTGSDHMESPDRRDTPV